jgi:hypothetical protein
MRARFRKRVKESHERRTRVREQDEEIQSQRESQPE